MFVAFCIRPDCEWESVPTFADSLAALRAIDAHLLAEHGRKGAIVGIATDEADSLIATALMDLDMGIRELEAAVA